MVLVTFLCIFHILNVSTKNMYTNDAFCMLFLNI